MTKNPVVNALLAYLYILGIGLILYLGSTVRLGQNTIFAPIALISLFTFSAAMMGYLFLYQPFVIYFDGKKKQAIDLFLKTLLSFGFITFIMFGILFFSTKI